MGGAANGAAVFSWDASARSVESAPAARSVPPSRSRSRRFKSSMLVLGKIVLSNGRNRVPCGANEGDCPVFAEDCLVHQTRSRKAGSGGGAVRPGPFAEARFEGVWRSDRPQRSI